MCEDKPMKKLYDFSILPWGLTGMASQTYWVYGGNTVLKENKGIETVLENVGAFTIHASASKHIIDVHRCDHNYQMKQTEEIPLEEELFFNGCVAIYKNDELLRTGQIWFGIQKSTEYLLNDLVFGDANTQEKKQEIIEMILNAYEHKDKVNGENQHRKEMRSFESGRDSMHFDVKHGNVSLRG